MSEEQDKVNKDLQGLIEYLFASNVLLRAKTEVLEDAIIDILEDLDLEPVPPRPWAATLHDATVQRCYLNLAELSDCHPFSAGRIKPLIDKMIGQSSSNPDAEQE